VRAQDARRAELPRKENAEKSLFFKLHISEMHATFFGGAPTEN